MGNVYSSYKYLITNSEENLRFFKEPIFVWTDVPDATANVLLVYLIGGVLPIVSLLMTAMLTSYLEKDSEIEEETNEYDEDTEDNEEDEGIDDENPGYVSPYKEEHIEDEENYIPPIELTPGKEIEPEEEKIEEPKIESHSINI